MTRIYMVRHCEAMGNVNRLFQGTSNFDISEMGEKQLEFLTERFKDIHLDRIYTSPLIRAEKTAKAVAGKRDIPIIPFDGLIEINGGILEGHSFKESFTKYPELADKWVNAPHEFAPRDGEPMWEAYERIWTAVKTLAKENKGKTIAAATHGGVTRCLICRLTMGKKEALKEMDWTENTAVTLIEFDDELNAKLVYQNDYSHLPEEFLPKRNGISSYTRPVRE